MNESPKEGVIIELDNESLVKLLRDNLCCHLGKNITYELLNELTNQIVESIDYFINKKS